MLPVIKTSTTNLSKRQRTPEPGGRDGGRDGERVFGRDGRHGWMVGRWDDEQGWTDGHGGRIGRAWVSQAGDRRFEPMVETNQLLINFILVASLARCSALLGEGKE